MSHAAKPGADQGRGAADRSGEEVRETPGEKPGDLPVEVPTRYHLTINFKTAKSLRPAAPPTLVVRADEVPE
jgi:putative tryptophan/tyrosine transport system substrate-binding protein